MARGERVVVAAGLATASIVLGVLVACGWWSLDTLRTSMQQSRAAQAGIVAQLLSRSAETGLSDTEWTSLRRLVAESAQAYRLRSCRIVLGDGTVLADADPKKISRSVPENWPPIAAPGDGSPSEDGVITIYVPILVNGRGQALLEVSSNVEYPAWADWEAQAGLGAIGAAALGGLLLVYRTMRRRWRALGAVGDALRWEASGKATRGSLWVHEAFGPDAVAWNALIAERDQLREAHPSAVAAATGAGAGVSEGGVTTALDALWIGVLVLDSDTAVRYVNGAAGVLLKATREDIAGQPVSKFLPEPEFNSTITELIGGKGGVRASVEFARAGAQGDRTVLRTTARRLRREDGAAAVVVIEDITQQRVADESRNAFVAQATHELRTPLTSMRLYVETLLDEGERDEQVRAKCLNVIASETRRLERIVGDMLSVAEIEAGALKLRSAEVRLDALFEELHADFRAQAEDKDITLAFELPPKLPVMQGDRDKVLLALHNLVGNALKYTPAGGRVTVTVVVEGNTLAVAVADNGIGIKPEEQELVFERFYRAKDRRIAGITGSGIGLALARQVARLHGGDITVHSQLDKGSTFTLTLPIAPSETRRLAA
ncbi:MAG: hypothetical protein HBSAPP03_24790 [Phycisphaerae bacterium]|nr:MAG: hypothetical protein HBSAPP03_24790 [Phycisphaerae bacterium]